MRAQRESQKVVPGGSFVCAYGDATSSFHYEKEAGDRLRMVLDGFVVALEVEKDPSKLDAPYGGKLTKYVASGPALTAIAARSLR